MSVNLSPVFNDTQFKSDGTLASGYLVYTYAEGSTTPLATFTTSAGTVAQANPMVLNSRGELDNPCWITSGFGYKFVYKTAAGATLKTIDNVRGVNDTTVSADQWVASGLAPTYVSATSFTLVGDQTSLFHAGRELKSTVTAGTTYSHILTSVYGALTTITVVNDSGILDSGLSAVSYGLISAVNSSLPSTVALTASIQSQTYTAFTTAGTSSEFTLTTVPATTANATNQRFQVKLHTAPTGSPTLAVNGFAALSLKYYDAAGNKQFINSTVAPSGWVSDVINDGTDYVMQAVMPKSSSKIQSITCTQASGALTFTLNPTELDFRSTTLTSGVPTTVSTPAITLVLPSGSTMGVPTTKIGTLALIAINNAGSVELAVINNQNNALMDEGQLISTTAIDTASDSDNVFYSTTARTNIGWRYIGTIQTVNTAGAWSSPTVVTGGFPTARPKRSYTVNVATTSGTSISFPAVPAWVNKITFTLNGVSSADNELPVIQFSVASVFVTTGYVSGASSITTGGTAALATTTSGIYIYNILAAETSSGLFTLVRNGSSWAASGNTYRPGSAMQHIAGGIPSIGQIDGVRILAVSAFDGGSVVAIFEE